MGTIFPVGLGGCLPFQSPSGGRTLARVRTNKSDRAHSGRRGHGRRALRPVRQPDPLDDVKWREGLGVCPHCLILGDYRESRDELRMNACAYLPSRDPLWGEPGNQILHVLSLADRLERLHSELTGVWWVEEMRRAFEGA